MFVSTHMIVKENTNLGKRFLGAAFESMHQAQFPNELILVDNGSNPTVFDEVYEPWKVKFKDFDCELKVISCPEQQPFSNLRNICIEKTSPHCNFIIWQDSDEVYYPEDLELLKHFVMPEYPIARVIWSYFYHHVITPQVTQVNVDKVKAGLPLTLDDYRCSKDNIFAFTPNLKWEFPVHEKLTGLSEGDAVQGSCEYLHYGYCRPQWRTTIKWLRYALLEFGHINMYKHENIEIDEDGKNVLDTKKPVVKMIQKDYFRDWRTFDNLLWDRRPFCFPYPNPEVGTRQHLPDAAIKLNNGCKNEKEWVEYLEKLDPSDFPYQWKEKEKELGVNGALDWVVDEMNKVNWALAW